MLLSPILSLALMQAVAGNQPLSGLPPELAPEARRAATSSPDTDRLALCLRQARRDPAAALSTADAWEDQASGATRAQPLQCRGHAYVSLLRWDAAEQAFLDARDALGSADPVTGAKLAGMAANAALAGGDATRALASTDLATRDARAGGDAVLAGELSADRARALVALSRIEDAAAALEVTRRDAPQFATGWLLSATLARRMERLGDAQQFVETAATLAPNDPAVALEGGLIAALAGRDEAARQSWQSVIDMAAGSDEAATARGYLAQLAGAEPAQ